MSSKHNKNSRSFKNLVRALAEHHAVSYTTALRMLEKTNNKLNDQQEPAQEQLSSSPWVLHTPETDNLFLNTSLGEPCEIWIIAGRAGTGKTHLILETLRATGHLGTKRTCVLSNMPNEYRDDNDSNRVVLDSSGNETELDELTRISMRLRAEVLIVDEYRSNVHFGAEHIGLMADVGYGVAVVLHSTAATPEELIRTIEWSLPGLDRERITGVVITDDKHQSFDHKVWQRTRRA